MLTQAVRVQIVKPVNATWDEFGKVLQELSFQTVLMANRCIQLYWEWDNQRWQYKAENGRYPDEKDIFGCTFRNHVYRQLREMFPLMASLNTSQLNQFALKRWQTDLPDIRSLKKSIPNFKLGTPIQVAKQNFTLSMDHNTYLADITLLSKEAKLGRFQVILDAGDNSKKSILRNIIGGQFKQGSMQIQNKKKKWFCIISYGFERCENKLIQDKVMGIDMGIVYPIYWAISDSPKRGKIEGGEIDAFRKNVEARRRSMLRVAGQNGHGRARKLQATEKLAGKIANFRDTINHKYSSMIVKAAVANKCGIIQMEDLSGISQDSMFLKNWTYYDLQQKIAYKAKREGVRVRLIDPHYTSQTCSECGYVDNENRENQATFVCKECGYTANADYNAARNIAKSDNVVKEL